MPYVVREVDTLHQFALLEHVIWKAHHHPYQPHFSAYHPVFGPSASDREAAINRSIDRKWTAHQADNSSRWLCVTDESTGEIVGGCQWKIYLQNPYSDAGHGDGSLSSSGPSSAYDPSMWPEGSVGRAFVEAMMDRQYAHRRRWLRRPHAVCQQMAVLPSHRSRGIGRLLMSWGLAIAERNKLELFLHSTEMARRLYETCGLRVICKTDIDMSVEEPSDEWEKLRHELGPLRFFIMWKPVDGLYEVGRTQLPWEIQNSR